MSQSQRGQPVPHRLNSVCQRPPGLIPLTYHPPPLPLSHLQGEGPVQHPMRRESSIPPETPWNCLSRSFRHLYLLFHPSGPSTIYPRGNPPRGLMINSRKSIPLPSFSKLPLRMGTLLSTLGPLLRARRRLLRKQARSSFLPDSKSPPSLPGSC